MSDRVRLPYNAMEAETEHDHTTKFQAHDEIGDRRQEDSLFQKPLPIKVYKRHRAIVRMRRLKRLKKPQRTFTDLPYCLKSLLDITEMAKYEPFTVDVLPGGLICTVDKYRISVPNVFTEHYQNYIAYAKRQLAKRIRENNFDEEEDPVLEIANMGFFDDAELEEDVNSDGPGDEDLQDVVDDTLQNEEDRLVANVVANTGDNTGAASSSSSSFQAVGISSDESKQADNVMEQTEEQDSQPVVHLVSEHSEEPTEQPSTEQSSCQPSIKQQKMVHEPTPSQILEALFPGLQQPTIHRPVAQYPNAQHIIVHSSRTQKPMAPDSTHQMPYFRRPPPLPPVVLPSMSFLQQPMRPIAPPRAPDVASTYWKQMANEKMIERINSTGHYLKAQLWMKCPRRRNRLPKNVQHLDIKTIMDSDGEDETKLIGIARDIIRTQGLSPGKDFVTAFNEHFFFCLCLTKTPEDEPIFKRCNLRNFFLDPPIFEEIACTTGFDSEEERRKYELRKDKYPNDFTSEVVKYCEDGYWIHHIHPFPGNVRLPPRPSDIDQIMKVNMPAPKILLFLSMSGDPEKEEIVNDTYRALGCKMKNATRRRK